MRSSENVAVKKIIRSGDVAELVSTAEALGQALVRPLSSNQIRTIFGEVRQIEANWPPYHEGLSEENREKAKDAYRKTVLLRPKLAYQASRDRGGGVERLREALDPCLEAIQAAPTDRERKLYFDRFVDFFEAILAYHKAAGGK